MRGVLSVATVSLLDNASDYGGGSDGSAEGGAVLVVGGTGFSSQAARMRVALLDSASAAELAHCDVLESSPVSILYTKDVLESAATGELYCRIGPAAAPLAIAGATVTVNVSLVDESGLVLAHAASASGAFSFLAAAATPTLETASASGGSSAGGLVYCLSGERLDGSAHEVLLGSALCPPLSSSDGLVCCVTPPHAVGTVNVTLRLAGLGDALQPSPRLQFEYEAAPQLAVPQLAAVSPATGHPGSTLVLLGSGLVGGTASSAVEVLLGGTLCTDVQGNSTRLECTVPSVAPGTVVTPQVRVPTVGYAEAASSVSFAFQAAVTAVSPTSGSGGGTLLAIYY